MARRRPQRPPRGRGAAARRGRRRWSCAEDHLTTLLLEHDPSLIAELAERRLAPLADATPAQRERLLETLGAWLLHHGSVPDVARAIHVHPQTVRYRLNQLRELFGDLDDPDARFELLLVTRARGLAPRVVAPMSRTAALQPVPSCA